MADETTEGAEDATSDSEQETQEGGQPAELGEKGTKALKSEREARAAAEKKAKELEAQIDELRKAQMSDQERAIEETKAAVRAEVLGEMAGKLVDAEFKAAAAGRLDDEALLTLLEGVNRKSFLADDGDVLADKVRSFVEGITPTPSDRPADLGQGARSTHGLGSDPLLQALKNTVGAR